jgi:hypothetical protein
LLASKSFPLLQYAAIDLAEVKPGKADKAKILLRVCGH